MTIRITGLQENIDALNAIAQALQDEMPGVVSEATAPFMYALQDYPDRVSSYVRTYALRESTYSLVEANGWTVTDTLGQTDSAGYWVGHNIDPYQAWMHQGIWETAAAIVTRLLPAVWNEVNDKVNALIHRIWGR